MDYLDDIEKRIHQLFPKFRQNLCRIILHRKKVFIDSGLAKSAKRAMRIIKESRPEVINKNPSELKYQKGSLEESPFQYEYSFLEYMYEARIAWAEELSKNVKESEPNNIKCQKIFKAWVSLIMEKYSGDKNFMYSICKAYSNNLNEWLKDVETRETELKDILDFYFYFSSRPIDEDWSKMVKQECGIVDYFEREYKNDKMPQYWHKIDAITKILQNSKNLDDVWKSSLVSEDFRNFDLLPLVLQEEQNRYKEAQNLLVQSFSKAKQRTDDIEQIYSILRKYYQQKYEEKLCLNRILNFTVFEFLLRIPCLSASDPYIKPVLEYFVDFLKLILEVICHQSAFNRTNYALRNEELIEIVLNKLKLEKDDKFLDMFSNIPVVSYCASLLGAKVYSVDCDFVETSRFTNSLREMYVKQIEFYRNLRNIFTAPKMALEKLSNIPYEELKHLYRLQSYIGGPFMQDAVDAQAVYVSLKFFSFFSKIIERNPPKFLSHRFSLEEAYKNEDKANLGNNYFDKMLIDPPYGKETAQEGFGPEQGLIIAKKGLKEASRILRHGGKAVLTLPSYKWTEFKEMQWREKVLCFAKDSGFIQIDRDLPEGRALVLLQKQ